MQNIMNSLCDYIDTLGLYAPVDIDVFKGDLEEIIVRHEPGQAKPITYMDGSREGQFNFSIFCKSQDGQKAVNELSGLITSLDIRDDLSLTDLLKVKMEPLTTVRFITKTEKLEFIYSVDFSLTYTEKRR